MTSRLRVQARRLGAVVVLLLGPGLVAAAPSADAAAPTAAQVAAYEARVIHLINVVRATNRRVAMVPAACADGYAERFAAGLANTGYFYHQKLTPILSSCRATLAAENLARGYSADGTYIAWMRSPGHKANILDSRLNRIGVAAAYGRGGWTVVAVFTRN